MLASILRAFGLAPFKALLDAESELIAVKGALKLKQDDNDNIKAMSKKLIADYDALRTEPKPFFAVMMEPKRLTLHFRRSALDPSPVIVKQGVRNKSNEQHYSELCAACNALIENKGSASVGKTNPHAGIPMTDKPR